MKTKNRYQYRSRISEAKFREIVKLFALDLEATKVAELTNLNRNTINRYFHIFRQRIAQESKQQLKECKFRFNNRNENLYIMLLDL
jgi:hypothetical protein